MRGAITQNESPTTLKLEGARRSDPSELLTKGVQRGLRWIVIDQLRTHGVNLIQVPEIVAIFVREERSKESSAQ
jgi:hypothetical protein